MWANQPGSWFYLANLLTYSHIWQSGARKNIFFFFKRQKRRDEWRVFILKRVGCGVNGPECKVRTPGRQVTRVFLQVAGPGRNLTRVGRNVYGPGCHLKGAECKVTGSFWKWTDRNGKWNERNRMFTAREEKWQERNAMCSVWDDKWWGGFWMWTDRDGEWTCPFLKLLDSFGFIFCFWLLCYSQIADSRLRWFYVFPKGVFNKPWQLLNRSLKVIFKLWLIVAQLKVWLIRPGKSSAHPISLSWRMR